MSEDFGYQRCTTNTFERGVTKIAIFANQFGPQHVAIQLPSRNGKWMSKMGYNIDMEHELSAIASDCYGNVVELMRKSK